MSLEPDKKIEHLEYTQVRGVSALEALIDDGPFCIGQSLTLADLFFVPQMRNIIERFKVKRKRNN